MRRLFLLLWLYSVSVYAVTTDFDDVIVGTSPISMFEAVYRTAIGHRVLVVEQANECGGAWKSINICGIEHVDMGCHEFGSDPRLQKFLEEYAGCAVVQNAPAAKGRSGSNGLYPSGGCYELTHHLELLMHKLGTILLLGSKLESVYIDTARQIAEAKVNGMKYTTQKVVVTHCSEIKFENIPGGGISSRTKYPHIYLLISDPTPPRFTYMHLNSQGISRAMNVTQFAGLGGTGMQLIAFQVYGEQYLNHAEQCLSELKRMNMIDGGAQILRKENYVFEQGSFNQGALHQIGPAAVAVFEVLNTGHVANIGNYAEKWKGGMKPWNEMMNY